MEFRRSGQRDDRRRRVFMEDAPAEDESPNADGKPSKRGGASERGPRYAATAQAASELRLTDFIPQRPWTVTVLLLLGLVAMAAVEALYVLAFESASVARYASLTPLDVSARGSVHAWVSSLMLLCAAGMSLLIYSIRRHRLDDYRGRYRLWLPIAGMLLCGSLDVACAFHTSLGELLSRFAISRLHANATQSWVALYCLVIFGVSLRVAFELRESRLAVSALATALLLYGLTALLAVQAISSGIAFLDSVAQSTVELMSHLSVVAAALLYVRHVFLDAQGLIAERANKQSAKPRKRKAKAKKPVLKLRKASDSDDEPTTPRTNKKSVADPDDTEGDSANDNRGGSQQKQGTRSASRSAASAPTLRMAESSTDDSDDENLSKSERRRLRKLQRRDAKKAA